MISSRAFEAAILGARRGCNKNGQSGVALFVGLVFLVILSMVALVAMRGTLLDMRLTTATARHEQAFEASEVARELPEAVMASHINNRGWPVSWGGNVPDSSFGLTATFAGRLAWIKILGNGLKNACGQANGAKISFYLPQSSCAAQAASYNYSPTTWYPAFVFSTCADGSTGNGVQCPASKQISNTVSIIRDGVSLTVGNGAAQAQGYSSAGVGSSKGGSVLLLQVRSDSIVPGNGEAVTISQYKFSINQ